MQTNRRDILKLMAVATAAALLPENSLPTDSSEAPDTSKSFGVLVDTSLCIGCRKCELACNRQHFNSDRPAESFNDKSVYNMHRRPDEHAYTVVNKHTDSDPEKYATMKVQCMHCVDPACASACLVGALKKDPRGPVTYDANKCMGCRYCMVACPFEIPAFEYFDPLTPRVRKCDFCSERVLKEGLPPACVAACPNEALTFGKRSDLIDLAHERIRVHPERYVDHVYGETEAGGTSWLYLSPIDFRETELPKLGQEAPHAKTEKIQHGIFKYFLPPVALYGILGLVMKTTAKPHDQSENASE